jgi:hypothetical protein
MNPLLADGLTNHQNGRLRDRQFWWKGHSGAPQTYVYRYAYNYAGMIKGTMNGSRTSQGQP